MSEFKPGDIVECVETWVSFVKGTLYRLYDWTGRERLSVNDNAGDRIAFDQRVAKLFRLHAPGGFQVGDVLEYRDSKRQHCQLIRGHYYHVNVVIGHGVSLTGETELWNWSRFRLAFRVGDVVEFVRPAGLWGAGAQGDVANVARESIKVMALVSGEAEWVPIDSVRAVMRDGVSLEESPAEEFKAEFQPVPGEPGYVLPSCRAKVTKPEPAREAEGGLVTIDATGTPLTQYLVCVAQAALRRRGLAPIQMAGHVHMAHAFGLEFELTDTIRGSLATDFGVLELVLADEAWPRDVVALLGAEGEMLAQIINLVPAAPAKPRVNYTTRQEAKKEWRRSMSQVNTKVSQSAELLRCQVCKVQGGDVEERPRPIGALLCGECSERERSGQCAPEAFGCCLQPVGHEGPCDYERVMIDKRRERKEPDETYNASDWGQVPDELCEPLPPPPTMPACGGGLPKLLAKTAEPVLRQGWDHVTVGSAQRYRELVELTNCSIHPDEPRLYVYANDVQGDVVVYRSVGGGWVAFQARRQAAKTHLFGAVAAMRWAEERLLP